MLSFFSQKNIVETLISERYSKAQDDLIHFKGITWNTGKEAVKYVSVSFFFRFLINI